MGGLTSIGRARAKVFDTDRPGTTFASVAGYEGANAEISEVVEFLRNPDRFRRAGVDGPRVRLVRPSGTGQLPDRRRSVAARRSGGELPAIRRGHPRAIDREVERPLRQAEEQATTLLEQHRPALQQLTEALLAHETVDGATVEDIPHKAEGGRSAAARGEREYTLGRHGSPDRKAS